eukprot:TRINITY_DN96992_c0_g1_i1.p1 TRINITY_DN96992_c0_g1~~TRINITY_DN96992_c0_g1_i1.p1  ORF type:complete len:227 (+),score=41.20 TRINITY_DN96992_c0_g1_i1:65-745(+)
MIIATGFKANPYQDQLKSCCLVMLHFVRCLASSDDARCPAHLCKVLHQLGVPDVTPNTLDANMLGDNQRRDLKMCRDLLFTTDLSVSSDDFISIFEQLLKCSAIICAGAKETVTKACKEVYDKLAAVTFPPITESNQHAFLEVMTSAQCATLSAQEAEGEQVIRHATSMAESWGITLQTLCPLLDALHKENRRVLLGVSTVIALKTLNSKAAQKELPNAIENAKKR